MVHGTPVAPDAGVWLVTVGTAAAVVVVNDQEEGATITLPAASVTPLIVAVYLVEADSGELGVRVAVWLLSV